MNIIITDGKTTKEIESKDIKQICIDKNGKIKITVDCMKCAEIKMLGFKTVETAEFFKI